MITFEVEAVSTAAPHEVWALLGDVRTWATWAPFDASELEAPGDDMAEPNGVGAIRRFRRGRRTTRESVVVFEPDAHLAYVLLSGVRAREYRADVTLTRTADGGTRIDWRSSFRADVPGTGWLTKVFLRHFVRQVARALAAAAA